MVPEAVLPPVTPSTDQVVVPVPFTVVNCCVIEVVSTVTLGLTWKFPPPPVPPVPLRAIVCGLFWALSVIDMDAVRVPAAVGVKVTLMVQPALGATAAGQLLLCPKSVLLAPVTAMPVMFSCAVPVFVRVTGCAGLVVPVPWLPNTRFVLLSVTTGAGDAEPT